MSRRRPKLSAEEAQARRAAKREQIDTLLADAPEALADPGTWAKFLAGPATFTKADGGPFSIRNQILIFMQAPESTDVAAYGTWQDRGRQVRKGETGIMVLAPVLRKADPEAEAKREPGEMSSDDLRSKLRGIKVATLFDVTQTDPVDGAEFVPAQYTRAALLEEYREILREIGTEEADEVLTAMDEAEGEAEAASAAEDALTAMDGADA